MKNIWSIFKPVVSAFFGNSPNQKLIDIANNFNLAVTGENISKVMMAMNKLDILKPVKNAMAWMRPNYSQMRGMMGLSDVRVESSKPVVTRELNPK